MSDLLAGKDLLVSASTVSGAPPLSPSRYSLEERLVAAGSAGFTGTGIAWQEYSTWRAAGISASAMAAMTAEHGVRVAELEFLHGWASDDPDVRRTATRAEDVVWDMADVFGARHVNVGDIGGLPRPDSFEGVVDRFSGLCERASRHGLLVGYEWFAGTMLPDLHAAVRLVEAANQVNAGLLVDVVHLFRAYANGVQEAVRSLPPDRVVAVQIADGDLSQIGMYAAHPHSPEPSATFPRPTLLSRQLPGEGSFQLVSVLGALADTGVNAPIGVEIISPEMRALAPVEAAGAAYRAAMSVLERARAIYHS